MTGLIRLMQLMMVAVSVSKQYTGLREDIGYGLTINELQQLGITQQQAEGIL